MDTDNEKETSENEKEDDDKTEKKDDKDVTYTLIDSISKKLYEY